MPCLPKLVVEDLATLTRFYAGAFEMRAMTTVESDWAVETILRGAEGALLILYHYRDGPALTLGSAYGPIVLVVEDVDGAYERALAHGASTLKAPTNVDYRGPDGAGMLRAAFVADPEGRPIEIVSTEIRELLRKTQTVTL